MKKTLPYKKKLNNLAKALSFLALIVLGSTTSNVSAQNWYEVIKTVASDRDVYDLFGISIAISGDYAIVGAPREDHNVAGLNYIEDAGAAYIFKNISGTWTEVQKIVASDRGTGVEFGGSVAISGDYAVVGADYKNAYGIGGNVIFDAGAAYIFKNIGGTWTEVQLIQASTPVDEDFFGNSVAISGDIVMVGSWKDDHYLSGGLILDAGSVYVFQDIAGTWSQVQKIVPSDTGADDSFGWSVAISGDFAIVGARDDNQNATGGNPLGHAGSAYIFNKNISGTWLPVQKIVASDRSPNDEFGGSVSISGDYAIVGAMFQNLNSSGGVNVIDAGAAYIFKNNAGSWSQMQKIVASDRDESDQFGASVAISGDYVIVGAITEDNGSAGGNTVSNAGSAYIFKKTASTWTQVQKIVTSDRSANDNFGWSVAISGEYTMISALNEDEDPFGANTLLSAGSVYVFQNNTPVGNVENKISYQYSVFPNPTNGNFSIDLGAVHGNTIVSITDVSGRLIDSKKFTNQQMLHLSIDQPAGIYFIAVQTDNKKVFLRCVKQ